MLLVAVTALQIMTAECRVACLHSGYSTGFYEKEACACVDYKDYKYMTQEARTVLSGKKKGEAKGVSVYNRGDY